MAVSLHRVAAGLNTSQHPLSSKTSNLASNQLHFSVSLKKLSADSGLTFTRRISKCKTSSRRREVVRALLQNEQNVEEFTCVMKFGGSSVASAGRMREVASLILSFPHERPIIVLSAMGKATNKLLEAGEKAVSCGVSNVSQIDELTFIKELHYKTTSELGIDRSTISAHLEELEQLLKGIAMMKELTPRTRDYLVSFGECMSTRIFASYMNKIGAKARQYDAFDIGFITTDDFTNADILEATYPAVANRLHGDWIADPAIPIVTGFLGKGWKSCAVTTLGRGGSDLTATTLGKALGLREIQVWKDVDGVLTCDPNIYSRAEPVPYLTFDEAAELAYFGAQMDRASILGDAIDYLKELLQKINDLQNELESNPSSSSLPLTPSFHPLTPTPPTLPFRVKEELFPSALSSPNGQPARVEVRVREGGAVNVHMFCSRRPGLLLSAMKALDDVGLDIQQAVISCFDGFALDVFRAECKEGTEVAPDVLKTMLLNSAGGFHNVM